MNKVIIAVVTVGCLAGGAYLWHTQSAVEPEPVSTVSKLGPKPAPRPPPPLTETAGAEKPAKVEGDRAEPAWMRAASAPESPIAKMPEPSPADEREKERMARMQKAVERAQALQSKPNVTPAEAMQALKEIEAANGSPNLNGIRLDVLRQNLEVADKMKSLSEEIQTLQPAVEAKKPGAMEALQAKIKEIEALQGRLKTDFYAKSPSTPMSATP